VSIANNPVENKLLQANLGNNLALTSFVAGNANTVLDTLRTGDWKFYVAPTTSIASISSATASSEWNGGTLLNGIEPSPGTLMNGATFAADANSRIPGKPYLQLTNGYSGTGGKYVKFPQFSIPTTGLSFAFWFWTDNSSHSSDYVFDIRTGGTIIGLILESGNNFSWQNNPLGTVRLLLLNPVTLSENVKVTKDVVPIRRAVVATTAERVGGVMSVGI
jgi:hypothetical protein